MKTHAGLPLPAAKLKMILGNGWQDISTLAAKSGLSEAQVVSWGSWLTEQHLAMGMVDDDGQPCAFHRPIPSWAYAAMFGDGDYGPA